MVLERLFGGAKKTARKAERDVKRGKEYADRVYDREVGGAVEAHKRGASAVGERFGRANKAAGEAAARSFGFSEDSEFASGFSDDGIDIVGERSSSDSIDLLGDSGGGSMDMPDSFGGTGGDNTPGIPDMMGDRNRDDDRLW